jgi:adenine-specific DNA methylase/REP element-mobilizing transposase RayT
MTKRKPVFIEKIFPIKLLNEQVYYENGGNPFKGLHRWYSRKPLSFSRASVLGSILPADVSMEEFEYLLGLEKREYRNKETKLYKTPPSPDRIKQVHALCEGMWGTSTPTVLDAFAGGGSIPFEAARYGLNVLASDLNPVAVVTMKAAIEFPLKFGPDLQQDIDKWVKWVGDEAEKRLAEFFPSEPNETVQNYLWAHTVVCPSCESVVPLSPNWWLYKRPEKQNLNKWCAVRPIPNLEQKRVDFELVKGKKGKGDSIVLESGEEYDPSTTTTVSRGVGKCPNCDSVIEDGVIKSQAQTGNFGHQLYATAFHTGKTSLDFRTPTKLDLDGVKKAVSTLETNDKLPDTQISVGSKTDELLRYGICKWSNLFNHRQLLTLVTYVEIINEVKEKLRLEYESDRVDAIATYLALVLDRCVDHNSRLSGWHSSRSAVDRASKMHSLNLVWNYPEVSGAGELWNWCSDAFISDYQNLCSLVGANQSINNFLQPVGQASSLSNPQNPPNPLNLSIPPNSSTISNLTETNFNLCIDDNAGQDAQPTGGDLRGDPNLKIGYSNWGKLPHWELHGSIYFITFNTFERLELTSAARQVILDACKFFDGQRYQLYTVVIMPDHVHLLIQPLSKSPDEYWSLSSILHSIKSYTAKQVGKVMTHIGTLWQDSRFDRIIRDEREFLNTWEYIRQNPVKANLCSITEEYPFFWQLPEKDTDQIVGQAGSLSNLSNISNPSNISNLNISDEFGYLGQDAQATGIDTDPITMETEKISIIIASADALFHITDGSVDAIVTDPPYYSTIQYAELSDFFYVWQKRTLGDIFPDLFWAELTDKDREAVANPSRFRGMGTSPDELANQDYEAKMALAFAEYHRVLRDDGVMTVQFNHKDSGAWDILAKSLIDAGFEITASWAVSTENPQNLHQAQKNSVSSTVLLVCRKRDPDAGSAWWEDLRPEVANLVEQRAPEFEANDIDGIDLYLSAFGPALNVFSRHYPILNSSGEEVRPEEAFTEARKAVANYRFRKLAHIDTAGFDPLTIWYLLAWDAFRAREFPFDDARQLALAIGGFNISELKGAMKLLEVKSGTCRLLTPAQRAQKRAFSTNPDDFVLTSLVDALHATIAIYQEEQTIEPVRRFLRATELINNDLFMRAWEVTLKVIPLIRDSKKRIPEEQALADLWLAMDEIKAKVIYVQQELDLGTVQQSLF